MTECLYFHHVGIACQNIEAETETLAVIGYTREGEDFTDRIQGVRGRFLVGPGPRLELLTEIQGSQVLRPWLSRGIKMYHQAFEVDIIETAVAGLEGKGAHVVASAAESVAFGGQYITFLMMTNNMLIELIERGLPGEKQLDAESTGVVDVPSVRLRRPLSGSTGGDTPIRPIVKPLPMRRT